jgi:hypothetical protein
VRVTYVAGYEPGAGPPELQAIVLRLVVDAWEAIQGAGVASGIKSETLGDRSYTYFTAAEISGAAAHIGADWTNLSNRWRRRLL